MAEDETLSRLLVRMPNVSIFTVHIQLFNYGGPHVVVRSGSSLLMLKGSLYSI